MLWTSTRAYNTVLMSPTHTDAPPLCIHCKHFIPEDIFCRSHRAEYGHCRQFFNIHLVTGKKKYELACIARSSKDMCGTNGTYFEA